MYKRYTILFAAVLIFCFMALAWQSLRQQQSLSSRMIRLHVVAASDDPADQSRKLAVRDALLPQIAALTADCANADDAAAALEAGLPALRETAFEVLGTGEAVHATLAEERFPRRDYDTFSLPAGSYRALRVTLGAGAGHNWWCVAFPALCLPAGTEQGAGSFERTALAAGLTPKELELLSSESEHVQFKFRLLDWLAELLD
ncbi:MAG: stage II sporulation protein R [Oscillospiraceae bacterium]|nr:stage II sporulation protein R [Oscillospiraceae bacterium]